MLITRLSPPIPTPGPIALREPIPGRLPSFLLPLLFLLSAGCTQPEQTLLEMEEETVQEVVALLDAQAEAWSEGDIEGFVSIYSASCTFLGPDGINTGRQEVLERYRSSYPDARAMGRLDLQVIEARPAVQASRGLWGTVRLHQIGGVSVAARWTLSYPDRPDRTGLTLIVFRPFEEGWQIVQDASLSDQTR